MKVLLGIVTLVICSSILTLVHPITLPSIGISCIIIYGGGAVLDMALFKWWDRQHPTRDKYRGVSYEEREAMLANESMLKKKLADGVITQEEYQKQRVLLGLDSTFNEPSIRIQESPQSRALSAKLRELDDALSFGAITKEQYDQALADYKQKVTLFNGKGSMQKEASDPHSSVSSEFQIPPSKNSSEVIRRLVETPASQVPTPSAKEPATVLTTQNSQASSKDQKKFSPPLGILLAITIALTAAISIVGYQFYRFRQENYITIGILQEGTAELIDKNERLQKRVDDLLALLKDSQAKQRDLDTFYYQKIGFVRMESYYYHKYDCSMVENLGDYLGLDAEMCEDLGYRPCPICWSK